MTSVDAPGPDALVHLRAHGVSVLLDLTAARLPSVLHWGADLGPLTVEDARAIALTQCPVIGGAALDQPVRVSVLPEQCAGFTGRPGLSGSRSGTAWSPRFTTTSILVDDTTVDQWYEGGAGVVAAHASDAETALALDLTLALLPSGLLRTRAVLTNAGDDYSLTDLVLALPVPDRARQLLDFAGVWSHERAPQRRDFVVGTHLRENRRGRTGSDAATVLHAGTTGFGFRHGEVWAVHTAWSGNHTTYAEATFDGVNLLGGGELLMPGEVMLSTGESYETPWLYGSWGRGLDAVAHRFHRYLRARPGHVSTDRPVTLNVWEAVYFDQDADRLIELADRAAEIGIERYVLDDGWFGGRRDDSAGLGDWVVSPEVWPEGLHPLVDAVRGHGMQFGLWVEPEMVNLNSDTARAHPEWIMAAGSHLPVPARNQYVLNLAIDECYQQVRDQLDALLTEYDIAYLKWDHNRDVLEAGDRTAGGRPRVHALTLAVYRLMAELKARHPGLQIESCSSGGARVDLGVLELTDRVWVSDCIDPHERQHMLRWTGQLLPPELMGSHIASDRSHTTGRTHDLNFRAVTAVFGHLGVEWDLAAATPRTRQELAKWIAWYKDHRDLLLSGTVVRGDVPDQHTYVHGVVSADRSEAVFAIVRLDTMPRDPAATVRFPGLDPSRQYFVAPVMVGVAPSGLDPTSRYPVPPDMVGAAPSGLVAPAWWGILEHAHAPDPSHPDAESSPYARFLGARLPGVVLTHVGVRQPRFHPDQAVLIHVSAAPPAPNAPPVPTTA